MSWRVQERFLLQLLVSTLRLGDNFCLKRILLKIISEPLQAGIIFTLLGAAADEVEKEEKKMKKGKTLKSFLGLIS